jgi:peptidoglycan/xylan/chitin deacetylase (PgdA/CDA1 family)
MSGRWRRVVRRAREAIPTQPGGALVLMYHRAIALEVDPWRLAVTPSHLSEHLDILARYTRPVTAANLTMDLDAARIPPRSVVVTFDDGYADLAGTVGPLLDRSGVSATMFLVSDAIDRDREFWWDALERSLLGEHPLPPRLVLELAGEVRTWELSGESQERPTPARPTSPAGRIGPWRAWQPPPTCRHRVYRSVWAALRSMPSGERDAAVDAVLAWAQQPATARPSHRTLRSDELARLARDGLIEIGGHTVTHPSLGALPIPAQQREIEDGRSQLEARIGRRIASLAYPYGGRPDVTPTTVGIARASGFDVAFTTEEGRVRTGDDRHALRRVFVDDLDGEGFGRLLRRVAGLRVG